MSRAYIPRDYQIVQGYTVPYYWMHEQSGRLRGAIGRYFNRCESQRDLNLTIAYVRYVLDCPSWAGDMAPLREQARVVETREDLDNLIEACLDAGIDPL